MNICSEVFRATHFGEKALLDQVLELREHLTAP